MQSSSLSTYIGYITGPRAEQPVGVRVVEPPPGTRQHQRGSLYTVVEVLGEHPDRMAIMERLLSEVQRVYYSAKGSQSQVMIEAVQQTQQLLREINAHMPHHPLQLGIVCVALLGNKLLAASSGPAFLLAYANAQVHLFPSEQSMAAASYGNVPVEIYRQDVKADDVLFLGSGNWLRRVQTRTLASIIAFTTADNCTDAADELFEQAGQMQVPGLLIVLGAGNHQEPPRPGGYGGSYPGSSGGGSGVGSDGGAQQRSAPRRPRFGNILPTALSTPPPARMPQGSSSSSPPTSQSSNVPLGETGDTTPAWEPPSTEASSPYATADNAAMDSGASTPTDVYSPALDTPSIETPLSSRTFETPGHELSQGQISPDQISPSQVSPRDASSADVDVDARGVVEPPSERPPMVKSVSVKPAPFDESKYATSTSPLEEQSFGGDLPIEPDAELDPIFPPSTPLPKAEKAERKPSWLEQWQAQTRLRMGQMREKVSQLLPDRDTAETKQGWEELPRSEVVAAPPASRPRYNELQTSSASVAVSDGFAQEAVDETVDEADEEFTEASAAPAPVLDTSPFVPPTPTRGARARLILLIALVIAILVPAVVLAINLGQGNSRRADAEQLTARAEIVLLGAQSALDQGDKVTARERLTEAQEYLAQAIALDGTNEHRAQLVANIELELQEVLQVTPLYGLTEPLITFPADARPTNVLVMNEDIFVIDAGRQALLQYRYDTATGTVNDQLGQVILSQGDVVGGVTVGTLADFAWMPLIPGIEDRPSLLITDRNNNVFRYDQRVEGATLLQFADRNTWGSIGQIQTYNGRIYLADEAKSALLRYNMGQFSTPGESWFSADTQPNLAGLTSMEIDGDIWLLFSNGMILRYRERQMLPFSPESSVGLAEEPSDLVVTRQASNYIYLVDAGQDIILVYDKTGAYIGQLRAPEGDLLRGLSGLYIDEVGGKMYILTQTGLFTHPVLP